MFKPMSEFMNLVNILVGVVVIALGVGTFSGLGYLDFSPKDCGYLHCTTGYGWKVERKSEGLKLADNGNVSPERHFLLFKGNERVKNLSLKIAATAVQEGTLSHHYSELGSDVDVQNGYNFEMRNISLARSLGLKQILMTLDDYGMYRPGEGMKMFLGSMQEVGELHVLTDAELMWEIMPWVLLSSLITFTFVLIFHDQILWFLNILAKKLLSRLSHPLPQQS